MRSRRPNPNRLARFTEQTASALLLAILICAPLILGGRTELGKCLYIGLVGLYVLNHCVGMWSAEERVYRIIGVEWLCVAGLALVALTIVPLTVDQLEQLSPGIFEAIPLRGPEAAQELGIWKTLSLAPHATQLGLCLLATHVLLFLTLAQRLVDVDSVRMALRCLVTATLVVAALGLFQYASGTERFCFAFLHPSRAAHEGLSGPFTNANHFTHFLALGMGALLWYWQDTVPKVDRGPTGNRFSSPNQNSQLRFQHVVATVGIGLVLTVGLIAASRGGMVMMFASLLFCGLIMARAQIIGWPTLWGAAGIAAVVMAALSIHGSEMLERELASLQVDSIGDLAELSGRQAIWEANLATAKAFPWFGTGVGSHAQVYPMFFAKPSTVEYTHAESGYLQVLSENGVAGLVLVGLALLALLRWCYQALVHAPDIRAGTCAMAAVAGVLVCLLQSVWDFVWYLTGTMAPAIVLAACVCRLAQQHRSRSQPAWTVSLNRAMTGLAAVATVAAFATGLWVYVGPAKASMSWNRYRRLSLAAERNRPDLATRVASKDKAKETQARYARLQQMTELLNRTLEAQPQHHSAHLRLASVLQKAFEIRQQYESNAMAITQIRDAAKASQFESDQAYASWLERAVGQNLQLLLSARHHLLAGVRGLPLSGRSYIRLGELDFLSPKLTIGIESLSEQAIKVRPHDAEVLFAFGRQRASQGDIEGTLDYWKRAYHQDEDYRQAITRILATRLPSLEFTKRFEPNRMQLLELFDFYRASQLPQQAEQLSPLLGQEFAAEAERSQGRRASHLWMQSAVFFQRAGEPNKAVQMAQLAARATPNHFETRLALARSLYLAAELEPAEREFIWCLRRRPDNTSAQRGLQATQVAMRQRGTPFPTGTPTVQ